jgi:HIV Tat-specific factor 1
MADDRAEEGIQSGFPQDPADFDADPRIAWSKLDEKFLLETDEGNEFEWDATLKRWIPMVGYILARLQTR